jgi:hypothetical protein
MLIKERIMAKYWKNLQCHEDTTTKRNLNVEDITFLKELQREMNTQDTQGQADPRYWVIRDYDRIYGERLNNPDGAVIVEQNSGNEEICDIKEDVFGRIDSIELAIQKLKEKFPDDFEDGYEVSLIFDMDDLEEFISYHDLPVKILQYQIIPIYSNIFSTQKAAEEHLRANDYHYNDNATTYAMTAWRSPEIEQLWKILREVDWEGIKA